MKSESKCDLLKVSVKQLKFTFWEKQSKSLPVTFSLTNLTGERVAFKVQMEILNFYLEIKYETV